METRVNARGIDMDIPNDTDLYLQQDFGRDLSCRITLADVRPGCTINKDVQENLSEHLAEKKTRFLTEKYGEGLCIGACFYVDMSVYFMYLYRYLL